MMIQYFCIGGFFSSHKQDNVIALCKRLQTFYTIGHIAAYSIVVFELGVLNQGCRISQPFLDIFNDSIELFNRFGGL